MEMYAEYPTTTSQEEVYVSSSSSSFSYCSASVVPLSSSPEQRTGLQGTLCREHLKANEESSVARLMKIRQLRFTDIEWTDFEDRFDRLASSRNGTESVLKWSDFGFCIGMQKTPEIANEILRALRGRREYKSNITMHELHGFWHRMTDPCIHSRV
ncbi:hypothetical protein ACOSQ4_016696 [Xanthoceras sorbifolium]